MIYHNFDIKIAAVTGRDDSYEVTLSTRPEGGGDITVEIKRPDDLDQHVKRLRAALEDSDRELGRVLAKKLMFPGAIMDKLGQAWAYVRGMARHAEEEHGLRIRLRLTAMTDLPWEYTYVDDLPDVGFLARTRGVSLVRHVVPEAGQGIWVDLRPLTGRPRVIVLSANPSGLAPLASHYEAERIRQELTEVEALELARDYTDATVEDLNRALSRSTSVFHFSGHGGLDEDKDTGYIVLCRKRLKRERTATPCKPRPFSAVELADALDKRHVRLAVLTACQSAHPSEDQEDQEDQRNPWSSVAAALIGRGLPAVVGMQYEITDPAATAFSRSFYSTLAEHKSIEEAIVEGRKAIYQSGSNAAKYLYWGVPVLYMHPELAKQEEASVIFPRGTGSSPGHRGEGGGSTSAGGKQPREDNQGNGDQDGIFSDVLLAVLAGVTALLVTVGAIYAYKDNFRCALLSVEVGPVRDGLAILAAVLLALGGIFIQQAGSIPKKPRIIGLVAISILLGLALGVVGWTTYHDATKEELRKQGMCTPAPVTSVQVQLWKNAKELPKDGQLSQLFGPDAGEAIVQIRLAEGPTSYLPDKVQWRCYWTYSDSSGKHFTEEVKNCDEFRASKPADSTSHTVAITLTAKLTERRGGQSLQSDEYAFTQGD